MELEFRKPVLDDKDSFRKILESSENINSESAFGTSYLWSEAFDINICVAESMLFKSVNNGSICYEFPKGADTTDKLKYAVSLLKKDCIKRKLDQLRFTELLDSEVEMLRKTFPDKFSFVANRNDFEYIYDIKDLANLEGKKYHSKRNHISKFNKLYEWKYVPISYDNKFECLSFSEEWFKTHTDEKNLNEIKEYIALKKAIENYESLNLLGGIIKVNDRIIAFSIGERINRNALLVHFEKALPEFEGSYSVISNEFCKNHAEDFKLVNREEDMGISGLRKSKLSYKPKFLLKKYNAKLED